MGVLHLWKPSFKYQMMTGGVAIPRSPQAFVAILVMVCVAQAWTKQKNEETSWNSPGYDGFRWIIDGFRYIAYRHRHNFRFLICLDFL